MKFTNIVFLCLLVTGCATSQNIPLASFKNLESGNALIVVERKRRWSASARTFEVSDNGEIIGKVSNGGTLRWQRAEGEMEIKLVKKWGFVDNPVPIKIMTEAGKAYYFEINNNGSRGEDTWQLWKE